MKLRFHMSYFFFFVYSLNIFPEKLQNFPIKRLRCHFRHFAPKCLAIQTPIIFALGAADLAFIFIYLYLLMTFAVPTLIHKVTNLKPYLARLYFCDFFFYLFKSFGAIYSIFCCAIS